MIFENNYDIEKIENLIEAEESLSTSFLYGELYQEIKAYLELANSYNDKKEKLENSIFYINLVSFLIVSFSLYLSSGGIFKALILMGTGFFAFSSLSHYSWLRRFSKNKAFEDIWSFILRGKVYSQQINFSLLEEKEKRIKELLKNNENKAILAKIYKDINQPDSKEGFLKNGFMKMFMDYKQNNIDGVLEQMLFNIKPLVNYLERENLKENADTLTDKFIFYDKKDKLLKHRQEKYRL